MVAEAERAFGAQGLCDGTEVEWRWSLTTPRRQVRLTAAEVADDPILTGAVAWSRPRPWLPALAWLCLPAASVVSVVLLARPSASVEWLAVPALVAVPLAAAGIAWGAGWMRYGVTRWRLRRVLCVSVPPTASTRVIWADAQEVADDAASSAVRIPDVLGPSEWLSADEVDGLSDARPARVAPSDLRHARRVVGRATAEPRASVPLPDGFTEWRPTRTP